MKSIVKRLTMLCVLVFVLDFFPAYAQQKNNESLFRQHGIYNFKRIEDPEIKAAELWELKTNASTRSLYSAYATSQSKKLNAAGSIDKDLFKMQQRYPIQADSENKWFVDVFIKLKQTSDIFFLSSLDFETSVQIGTICIGRIPIYRFPELAHSECVETFEVSQKSTPMIDTSISEINADDVHNGHTLPRSLEGSDVVVGVIDTGIDFTHPDFSDANGTRILYLYEMQQNGGEQEWRKSQIDSNPGAITQRDGDGGGGHGTHVTGTAAGNGHYNSNFVGVAPQSDIIFVKGIRDHESDGGFANSDVIKGCQYIFNKANQLNKPAVINLSIGGNYGPHDGTSLYEQSLSNLTGPGKLIVSSAGNSGNDFIHADAQLFTSKANVSIFWATDTTMYIDAWYTTRAVDSLAIVTWYRDYNNKFIVQNHTTLVAAGETVDRLPLYGAKDLGLDNTIIAYVSIDAITTSDSENGDGEIWLEIEKSEEFDLTTVPMALFWSNKKSGKMDMWVTRGGYFAPESEYNFSNQSVFTPTMGNNYSSCGSPGTAKKIISVGSYVTKNNWLDIDGYRRYWPNESAPYTIGDLSYFSSLGPTRDGRTAPDIAAPGEEIFSSLSSHLTEGVGYDRYKVLKGGKYQGMQGTSMASPHVAGVVALMLQADPNLDYEKTITILQETARYDGYTGSLPNYFFGAGKVDALAALQAMTPDRPTTVLREGFDNNFPPANWQRFKNVENTWLQGSFYDEKYSFSQIDPTSRYSAICKSDSIELQNESLVTPAYHFNRNRKFSLKFYTFYHPFFQDSASVRLWVSTDGLESFDLMWNSAIVANDGKGWTWRNTTVDLSQYQGVSNVQLIWQYYGRNGGTIALDGISLVESLTDVESVDAALPLKYDLGQNYPNPFNMHTTIQYEIARTDDIKLKIYNITGQQVRVLVDQNQQPGSHLIMWDGCDENGIPMPSGLYLYRIQSKDFQMTKRMILLK